jgi:hypothetical protein
MALVIGQVVRVRVAVVLDTTDNSVGQIYDEEAGQWADLVWIDLAGSTAMPLEFGDAEFWCEVYSLAVTRLSISRPAVRLRAWRSGGVKADTYEILTSGSTTSNVAKLQQTGADITTNLPGLGATLNKVRVFGFAAQQVGWTGRVPAALSWVRTYLALRKRVYFDPSAYYAYENQYLSGVAGFASDLGGFNGWLAANLPEYASPITIGAMLEFSRTLYYPGSGTYRYKYSTTFTLHCVLASDAGSWTWSARGALVQSLSIEASATICGGGTLSAFYGDTYAPNAANAASVMAANHQNGNTSGTFTTPAAGGGTVIASPRGVLYSGGPSYGVDVTLTVSPKGRITAVNVAGFSSDGTVEATTAWGACKMEGGYLA